MPELNVGPFPAKFPYRNEFEPNHNVNNNDISNNNNRKRNGDDVFLGENTVKKVSGRRGRPVKGTGYEGSLNGMPDILGGNRIYDSNNMNNNIHNMSNFRNIGDINNDRNNGNYSSENHGNHGNHGNGNQLPESTLYRVDSNGNYEAVINTNNIIQPKILKKPRKSNINNPKTLKISKNKKDLMNNNLLISDEDGKNIQNNNLGLNLSLGLNQTQIRGENRGEKTVINAMDALFWALDHDQQENDRLKQLEKDKEREREKEREKEIEKGKNHDNTVNIDENLKEIGEEKNGDEHESKNANETKMCTSNESNSNNVILTERKEMIGVEENEKMEERGDEEEKVGGEKERRENENENENENEKNKMDTEII